VVVVLVAVEFDFLVRLGFIEDFEEDCDGCCFTDDDVVPLVNSVAVVVVAGTGKLLGADVMGVVVVGVKL
ncbi:13206_t:CDS:2, partial [Entrophospora sp. SA101]